MTLSLPHPPAWMDDASCAQIGHAMADLWFPGKGGHAVEARNVCARCPVVEQCRQYAIDNNLIYGVWGGMTRDDLRDERARGVDVHFEAMSNNSFRIGIDFEDGTHWAINCGAVNDRAKGYAFAEEEA